ncbi:filamin-binding LIM protein 1 isoform A [Alligator mississippiensis]|uniref:Filamin-binding LIM protein 1 isoform A n=2 Tax=Alligator mississippiensis TaxID=8496 RepID=A0A151MJB5_ALLMI|nr:filamin-binding LIM protein 1 isoform A [Alligator mississippiensis]
MRLAGQFREWETPSPSWKMLSGKVEKRIASSVYITLAPPKRDVAVKGGIRPEVCQPSSEPLREAAKPAGTQPLQASPPKKLPSSCPAGKQNGRTLGPAGPSPGRGGWSNGGFSSFPRPADVPTGSAPNLPPPPPPPPCLLADAPHARPAETLIPDLQKLDVASPRPLQQASTVFPAEQRQHHSQLSSLAQAREQQDPKEGVNGHLDRDVSRDVCAFCHKAISARAPAIEAMRKQYHADCFTCRVCHCRLAGQRYYQRDGRPICNSCYQDTLEKCAKCQAVILKHIVRALGNGYHPACFTCVVCGRGIGDESFAVDDQDQVHCVDDFYRKYASVCSACEEPIIPNEGRDVYKIECLGRNFHEACYRCENCRIALSPEPTESGCYPLDSHIFCKACHLSQKNESSC